jgi:hypothetical protein
MWQSASQLEANLKSLPHISNLQALYWLSIFWRDAVYLREYKASEDWTTVLSANGAEILEKFNNTLTDGLIGGGRLTLFHMYIRTYHAQADHSDMKQPEQPTCRTSVMRSISHFAS